MNQDIKIFNKMKVEIFPKFEDSFLDIYIVPKLVHGKNIVEIKNNTEDISSCDAIFTHNKNFSLGIKTADCAAICISDGEKIGIMHIGWPGLCLGLTEDFLALFNLNNSVVYVGPFIHNFEIQRDFCYEKIQDKFGGKFIEENDSKLFFNFKKALEYILPKDTVFDERNTVFDLSLPSYRRDETKDRLFTTVSFNSNF